MKPYEPLGSVPMPSTYPDTGIMHMPLVLGEAPPVPAAFVATIRALYAYCTEHHGSVGYVTIDARDLAPNETHRRAGIHVDGVFQGSAGSWGGGGGGWGSATTGMLTVADAPGCRIWDCVVSPAACGPDGEVEHLRNLLGEGHTMSPGTAYRVHGLAPHESFAAPVRRRRAFVRLSMPSTAPWFDGYTPSPCGVRPTGPILPRRKYMERKQPPSAPDRGGHERGAR